MPSTLRNSSTHFLAADVDEYVLEYRILDRNNTVRWVTDRSHAFRDAEGQITGYVSVIVDISERMQRERELELLAATAAALSKVLTRARDSNRSCWRRCARRLTRTRQRLPEPISKAASVAWISAVASGRRRLVTCSDPRGDCWPRAVDAPALCQRRYSQPPADHAPRTRAACSCGCLCPLAQRRFGHGRAGRGPRQGAEPERRAALGHAWATWLPAPWIASPCLPRWSSAWQSVRRT